MSAPPHLIAGPITNRRGLLRRWWADWQTVWRVGNVSARSVWVERFLLGLIGIAFVSFFTWPEEEARWTIPLERIQSAESSDHSPPTLWRVALDENLLPLTRWPILPRNASFLFAGGRILPVVIDSQKVSKKVGWHRLQGENLLFQLPNGDDPTTTPQWTPLELELRGPVSVSRETIWFLGWGCAIALAAYGSRSRMWSPWPLLVLSALVPLIGIGSLFAEPMHGLPWSWVNSLVGRVLRRIVDLGPALLLGWTIIGRFADFRSTHRQFPPEQGETSSRWPAHQGLTIFSHWVHLAGLACLLGTYWVLISWGPGRLIGNDQTTMSSPFSSGVTWFDAREYLSGAFHLLDTGYFDEWNQRRPLNSSLFATRLALMGCSPSRALWLQLVLVSCALTFAAKEVAFRFGWRSGLATFALAWGLTRYVMLTVLSESLGITLGAVSLGMLLRGMRVKSRVCWLSGLAIMTLGQSARPGALFILPMLAILYAGTHHRAGRSLTPTDRASVRKTLLVRFVIACSVIGAFLQINPLLNRIYGTGDNLVGSNFAHTFLGLSMGKSWHEAQATFKAELDQLPHEKAKAVFMYSRGWRNLKEHPQTFLSELARGEMMFFKELPSTLVSFTNAFAASGIAARFRLQMLWVPILVALAMWRLRRDNRDRWFWIGTGAACLCSIPIVYLDGSFRVLAVTWPGMFAWLATGLAAPGRALPITSQRVSQYERSGLLGVGVITLTSLLGPLLAHQLVSRSPETQNLTPSTENGTETFKLSEQFAGPPLVVLPDNELASFNWREYQRQLQISELDLQNGPLEVAPPFVVQQIRESKIQTVVILWTQGRIPLRRPQVVRVRIWTPFPLAGLVLPEAQTP